MDSLTLSMVEIILLMLCGVMVGVVVFYIISSRRSFKEATSNVSGRSASELESWKLKYFNDIEVRDKELENLRERLSDIEENNNINVIEAEELNKENKLLKTEIENLRKATAAVQTDPYEIDDLRSTNKLLRTEIENLRKAAALVQTEPVELEELRTTNKLLQAEIDTLRKMPPPVQKLSSGKPDYIEQLREAQTSLLEHNEKINQLLGQIDIVKENEEKQNEILKANEELNLLIEDLKLKLSHKEKELTNVEQKAHLTKEMTSMLDNAYSEFNVLQDKMQKLEQQVSVSRKISLEYDDLKENHFKITRELEDQKIKLDTMAAENQELHHLLEQALEKQRDTSFQNQQLQKRVAYLEELNTDMQSVADTNKKLQSQLKRIGELESMLNIVSEEKNELASKKSKNL